MINGILILLGGCGVFMMGMKLMSDGLERSAGKGMRKLFAKISNNRFSGIGVGAGVTAIIQSSSATSVMVIGFVNAGLLTLFQATAIIMGANIGTTITGILVSLSSLNISVYASALTFVGVMMVMFSKRETVKKVGGILCGLGMIFVGLSLMSSAFSTSVEIKDFFGGMFASIDIPVILILVGIIFTGVIQSSSAVTGLIIIMVADGVLPVSLALFIVLGTNIGTCVTAVIAAVGASTNAKRAALIHLTFNVTGTVFFAIFLMIFRDPVVALLSSIFGDAAGMQIAWFHVAFNITTTLLLLPFIKPLTHFAEHMIKDKKDPKMLQHLYFIDERILHTPPIAVAQVLKETSNLAVIARGNLARAINCLFKQDVGEQEKILEEEAKINFINKEVATYLVKIASSNLSVSDEKVVGSLHHVISDIERIGDHAENLLEETQAMILSNVVFSEDALKELQAMYMLVDSLFTLTLATFEKRDASKLKEIAAIEEQVDFAKKTLGNSHIARLNKGLCSVDSGTYFYSVITGLERVADHLTNMAFSIKIRG